jgi:glycosyltransferase involved in cell wall biosynthesis
MDNPGELSDTLAELVEDAELRRRLSQGARRTAETDLSPKTFVERIERLLAK